jgi:hypothetical protein
LSSRRGHATWLAQSRVTGRFGWMAVLGVCAATAATQAPGFALLAQGVAASGGWGIFSPPSDHLPVAERAQIQTRIQANIAQLEADGRAAHATLPVLGLVVARPEQPFLHRRD